MAECVDLFACALHEGAHYISVHESSVSLGQCVDVYMALETTEHWRNTLEDNHYLKTCN